MRKVIGILALLVSMGSLADTLKLTNGSVLQGMLVSRSADSVVFEVAGNKMTFSTSEVASLDVEFAQPPAPKPVAAAPSTAPKAPAGVAVIPAGTPLLVKLGSSISTRQHKEGHLFSGVLQRNVMVNGQVAAPEGSKVIGKVTSSRQAGRLVGKSSLSIQLQELIVRGYPSQIRSRVLSAGGRGSAGNTLGKVIVGAGIGAAVDGSDGAKTGAAVGGGVALLTRGKAIEVPAGTLIEFQLEANAAVKSP